MSAFNIDRDANGETVRATLNGESSTFDIEGKGDGTLAAFCQGLEQRFGLTIEICQYDQHAKTGGTDAMALAFVQADISGKRYTSIAEHKDIMEASFNAILRCVSQAVETKPAAA